MNNIILLIIILVNYISYFSVTLYLAQKYPKSQITSISNSNTQRQYIMSTAAKRDLNNVTVFTGDITSFDLPAEYKDKADRVISIEMFEHMKNYEILLKKISTWLKPQGKVCIIINIKFSFAHL